VLHLSAHGSATGVELEDEDGNPVPVDTATFVRQLKAGGRPLPLIVLSSCGGAAGAGDALAARLVRHGADRVVAMQAAISDQYATRLAREFYKVLATRADLGVAGALAEARRRLEDKRLEAQQAGGAPQPPEYGVATVLAADGDPPLWERAAPPAPLARPTPIPIGTGVRELRIGDLIGRRQQLRTALTALRGGQTALDRFGALSGVALTGVGGIGKTALAGRIQTRLSGDGWMPAVHTGRWNPPALTEAVADAVAGDTRLADTQAALADPGVDDTTKLRVICQLLRRERLLLLFDDFEQNLTTGGDAYRDPGLAEVMNLLYEAADVGRLLVTCRYPLPDSDAYLLRIDVPPLSRSELGRLLLRLPALRELDAADRAVLVGMIGGHPRLIEFVNALLRHGHANLREVTSKLRRLARDHGIAVADTRPLTQAAQEAVQLGSRDIFLEELLAAITDEQQELLLQAAVSTLPLATEDLAVARWGEEPTAEQQASVTTAAERLVDLTLLSVADDEEFVVHPWIANALEPHQHGQADERHRHAVTMRLARVNGGRGSFGDLVEIAVHLAVTRQFDDLMRFAHEVTTINGLGELSVAAFLGQVIPMLPEDADGYLWLTGREQEALLNTSSVGAAVDRATAILTTAKRLAQADPTNARAQRDLGVAYEHLGDLMLMAVGNLGEAERLYRNSLAILDRLAQADPTNAEAQGSLSILYERLGDLMVAVGDLPEAERFYRDSLAIDQRLAQADPTNVEPQRHLCVACSKLGDLMVAAGNLAEAERFYRDSLAIRERLARADPTNAETQRHLSIAYGLLGKLMVAVGNLGEAERLYRDGLAIVQRLAQADPTNARAKRDLSVLCSNLGDLMLAAGNLGEAERFYRDSLAIRERLARADPTNGQAQRDLGVAYQRLGVLMRAVGNLGEAERFYRDSLSGIDRTFGQDDPQAQQIREELRKFEGGGDDEDRVDRR
jgi:tetratricopeptide (TPR) repeat protein